MSVEQLPTIWLPKRRWAEIELIERAVFGDTMPSNPRQTSFLTAVAENGDIAGYLRLEHLYHMVHVYADPAQRNHASLARQLMTEAAECIPSGFSAVWLTRKPYPQLAAQLQAQLVGGDRNRFLVYRRDNY